MFIANSDGSNAQQVPLVNPAEAFGVPVWSPDSTKLLISHTIRLDSAGQCCLFQPATVDLNGSNFNQLMPPTPVGGPSANGIDCWVWTLDQSRILCAFDDENAGAFSIRASDGGDPVRLTINPYASTGGQDLPTDISPDGTQFVFLRYRPGPSPAPREFQTQQVAIFVANMDGTGVRQITPYGLAHAHEFTSAQWSPDGLKIISETHGGRLFSVHPDGTGLTAIPLQTGTGQYFAYQPHWSPDGTRIVFLMFISGGQGVFTADPDGSDVKQVTFTTDFATLVNGPDWGTHPVVP